MLSDGQMQAMCNLTCNALALLISALQYDWMYVMAIKLGRCVRVYRTGDTTSSMCRFAKTNSRWARNVLPKATKVHSQDYRKTSELCWQMRIWLSGRYGACNLTLIDLRGDITYKAKCLQPGREGHDLQQPYSAAYCTQRSICFLGLGILPVCNKTWNHCNRSL